MIYVFGGWGSRGDITEAMDAQQCISGSQDVRWITIELARGNFLKSYKPQVAPISSTALVIIGGCWTSYEKRNETNSAISIFDFAEKEIDSFTMSDEHSIER